MIDSILKKIPQAHVCVIGDVMLDHYIWGDTYRISPEAPVPVVHVENDTYVAGGAANVSVNIRCLGAHSSLVGAMNPEDTAGRQLGEILDQHTVAHHPAGAQVDAPTIVKTRVIVRKQQICRIDREASPSAYALDVSAIDRVLNSAQPKPDCIILSDYAKGSITQELFDHITFTSKANGIRVIVDPKPLNKIHYRGADLLTPNQFEALQLADLPYDVHEDFPAEAVCQRIWDKYAPEHLMITLGPKGMLLCENGQITKQIPTFARDVFDVSGAGDTVIASLASALSTGADLIEAAEFANIAAGVVVAKVGTASATPQEIQDFYAKHPLYE